MSTVLRLEGLDVKAESEDIRTFFDDLYIPDGRVLIVGGHLREAFIVLTNESDGPLAMRRSGHFLKGSKVTLYISSMVELYKKTKSRLQQQKKKRLSRLVPDERPLLPPTTDPRSPLIPDERPLLPPTTDPRSQLIADEGHLIPRTTDPRSQLIADEGHLIPRTTDPRSQLIPDERHRIPQTIDPRSQLIPDERPLPPPTANPLPPIAPSNDTTVVSLLQCLLEQLQSNQQSQNNEESAAAVVDERMSADESYVRLFGLPASVTKEDICHFFKGLRVHEVIVNVKLGSCRACLVKFANVRDGSLALGFSQQRLGSVCVEVRRATEKMWTGAVEECANYAYEETSGTPVSPEPHYPEPQQIPLREPQRCRDSPKCQTPLGQRFRPWVKRRPKDQLPSRPHKKRKLDHTTTTDGSPPTAEYCIMVKNLPTTITKTEIKELFGCVVVSHNNILHLLNEDRQRTDTAFVKFDKAEDYVYAMNLHGCHVASRAISVSAVTEERMETMLTASHAAVHEMDKRRRSEPDVRPTAQTCVYIRNLPGDVRTTQISRLISLSTPEEGEIFVLRDECGNGIGEAVVHFESERVATRVWETLRGHTYLGIEMLFSCINVKQMRDLLKGNQ